MLLDPPAVLPVDHLSPSSYSLFKRCPEKWKRRYLDREYEPSSPSMLLGTAVGAAERDSWSQQIDTGTRLDVVEVLDAYDDAWKLAMEREGDRVAWDGEKPARVKDQGAKVLPVYHRLVAPMVEPIAVEREFVVRFPGLQWSFKGYFDVEEEHNVPDMKVRSRSRGLVSAEEAAADVQPTSYLFARRAEGLSANRFEFHSLVQPGKREPSGPRDVLVTPTYRTGEQLDAFALDLFAVAAEIAWRAEYEVWTGPAKGVWWCSDRWCGYHAKCQFGGGVRAIPQPEPRRAQPPTPAEVERAIAATAAKRGGKTTMAGATTAAKVASHLGVSTRSASGLLRGRVRAGAVIAGPMTRTKGRGAEKATIRVPGAPMQYQLAQGDVQDSPSPTRTVERAAA